MNSAKQSTQQQKPQQETWPQKLNKALIAIGVIAFGLIVTDRIIEMFSADDPPPAVRAEVERTPAAELASVVVQDTGVTEIDENILPAGATQNSTTVSEPSGNSDTVAVSDAQAGSSVDLHEIFGSRVVFVSASEPVYVVTEDDRRFDVGSEIDAQTTLAGVTAQQVILELAGDLTVISLPDPVLQ